ncbi:hypothetical protein LCGC14_0334380 [marine sediment metagenome]|uniref:Phage tail tape measure protein domain-containing protein n=1 Tax=marine sediment metagenome TaxID=412755 RepID=A0A0F9TFD4_9ZZZZ
MAFERIGVGGFLSFEEKKGIASMKRAGAAFGSLQKSAVSFGKGMSQVGVGLRAAGIAGIAVTAGLGIGLSIAVDFEKQMSAVGAITRSNTEDMTRLTDEAKRQGIVSVFSATESAEAMEALGRAGFDTSQIIEGLGGVMNAAAAEGIGLAESASIISRIVKSMGLEIGRASNVADILVLTSAKSNTNIVQLGEAFKFGAPQARQMGIQTEELAAIFGKLADSGLDASTGGTNFTNFLVKLTKPSKEGARVMKKWGIELEDANKNLLPIGDIVDQFSKKLKGIPSATERARLATELFGIRGAKAFGALESAGGKAIKDLTQDLLESSFGIGAAAEAAERRLDNLAGAFTLFKSSVQSIFIGFFDPLLGPFKETVQDITGGLNQVLDAFAGLQKNQKATADASVAAAKREVDGFAKKSFVLDQLSERQRGAAKAGLAAIVAQAAGEQKLSRSQAAAQATSMAQFVVGGLARQKLSDEEKIAQKSEIEGLAAIAKTRRLTAAEQATLRNKFIGSINAQADAETKIAGVVDRAKGNSAKSFIEQAAARAKIEGQIEGAIIRRERLEKIEREQGSTAATIAKGVLAGLDSVKAGFSSLVAGVRKFGKQLKDSVGEERLEQFFKIATIAVLVVGALAPVALAFAAIGFIASAVIGPIVAGLLLMAPILAVIGLAFLAVRKENETVGETVARVWNTIATFIDDTFTNVIEPFIEGFREGMGPAIDLVSRTFSSFFGVIKTLVNEIFAIFDDGTDDTATDWREVGMVVAEVLGNIVAVVTGVIGSIVTGFLVVTKFLVTALKEPFEGLFTSVKGILFGILQLFRGDFKAGLKTIMLSIGDIMMAPVRLFFSTISKLVDLTLGAFGDAIPPGIRKSLNAFAASTAKRAVTPDRTGFGFGVKAGTTEAVVEAADKDDKRKGGLSFGAFLASEEDKERAVLEGFGVEASKENLATARKILARRAEEEKARGKAAFEAAQKGLTADVNVNLKNVLNQEVKACIDGEDSLKNAAKHTQTIFERSGATTEPFIRRQMRETGVVVPATAST